MAGKSLADYMAEASRAPFVLDLGDGQSVTITQPTVADFAAIIENGETVLDVLQLLAGDQYGALMAALGPVPAPVLDKLLTDMRVHFGLGN